MNEIRVLRHKSGLSQRRFAESYGIPVRTLQQWEQGAQKPPSYVVDMLRGLEREKAKTCGVSEKSEYIAHVAANPSAWKICIAEPFPNCEKIHPLQQKKVRRIIDAVSQDPRVKEILIFGSSVTSRCHIGSDVDVYMTVTEDINPLSRSGLSVDFSYDLFTNYMVDERLLVEIRKKGVRVYGA